MQIGHFNANMWRQGLSKNSTCDCRADQQDGKSHHHGVPPILSTKWSPWLDRYWCRCSNSWVDTKQVPRDLIISFGYIRFHLQEESCNYLYMYDRPTSKKVPSGNGLKHCAQLWKKVTWYHVKQRTKMRAFYDSNWDSDALIY